MVNSEGYTTDNVYVDVVVMNDEGPSRVMVSECVEMIVEGHTKEALTGGQNNEIDVKPVL